MRFRKPFSLLHIALMALFLLSTFPGISAYAGEFSFVVFGDSRLPGNMSFTRDQQNTGGPIDRYIQANFHNKTIDDCMLRFSSDGRLTGFKIPKSGDTYKDISLNSAGWPEKITDTSQNPEKTLIYAGQAWVYAMVVNATRAVGNEAFVLHTGDISYNGYYGTSQAVSVYWRDFKERFLDKLPKGTPTGMVGRFFPAVGNHETWLDPRMAGLLNTIPHLQKLKVSADNHTYFFDYEGSRFIFLDSGGYPPPAGWGLDSKPGFFEQMTLLKGWLADAQDKHIDHVFIALHKPPFCGAGHGHLSADKNPHPYLKLFAEDERQPLDITVFTGHVHCTEMYLKNKIRYLVLGGGGADQVYRVNPCEQTDPYCKGELYWHGERRRMEFNYLTVAVDGKDVAMKLHRWRPGTAAPRQTGLIDKEMKVFIEK